ncbi:MAG: T9SS type A sorting domain-containing protein [Paludibacter sp.]|nr:T9SS type A sorting domain-containing protein [Paludibacter sp.]
MKKYIGDVSRLDREKYFTIHETSEDAELSMFYADYNTVKGRGFWGPAVYAVQKTGQVGVYLPNKNGNSSVRQVTRWVSTEHPRNIYKQGINADAVADWVVEYFKNYADMTSRAMYFEPMNEPFVNARDFYDEPDWDPVAEDRVKREMATIFKKIGEKIHQTTELSSMKVIGYASAFPEFERKNFSLWENNMKMFMDIAGEHMDAISYHLYDGINVIGTHKRRSGSNVDAIMDMIETYSYYKWGYVKPHAITEYGAADSDSKQYDNVYLMQGIRSQNHMIFQLLERQDRLEISIPFIVGKATWHITSANNYNPYHSVLFEPVPIGVPVNQVTGWKYNDKISFYKLWRDIKGERIDIRSDNPDIQAQAFSENSKLYVALNNLDDYQQLVDLNFMSSLPSIRHVLKKSLKIYTDKPAVYEEDMTTSIPGSIELEYGQTVVLELTFEQPIDFHQTLKKRRYYSLQHMKPIEMDLENSFQFKNVSVAKNGFASISLSFGRPISKSKRPTVTINGTLVEVPVNWKGYDQSNREDFFGAIDIPIPVSLLKNNNQISVTFPDSGGYISSVVLKLEELSNFINTSIDSKQTNFNMYPNPTKRFILIDGLTTNTELELYSIDGKLVGKFMYDGTGIDLVNVESGVYSLKMNDHSFRIIKQ